LVSRQAAIDVNNFRRKFLMFGALLGLGLVVILNLHREPEADGRTLSDWLELVREGKGTHTAATNAVRKIGTNAIPILLEKLARTDPMWKQKLQRTKLQGLISDEWVYASHPSIKQAYIGFAILGSDAAPVVPELSRMLQDSNLSWRTAFVLSYVGASGRAVLKAALTNPAPHVRHAGIVGLSASPEGLSDVWPELIELCRDSDRRVRGFTVLTVLNHPERLESRTVGMHAITNDADMGMQRLVLYKMEQHSNAVEFIPAIQHVMTNVTSHAVIKIAATNALQKILPMGATVNGIKPNAR
jgi:hypothetical protein